MTEKIRSTELTEEPLFDSPRTRDAKPWLVYIAPLTSNAAISVLGFLWLVLLINAFRIDRRLSNLLIFFASISILPMAVAAIQYRLRRNERDAMAVIFRSVSIWCAVLALLAFSVVGFANWEHEGFTTWPRYAPRAMEVVLGIHLVLVAAVLTFQRNRPNDLNRIATVIKPFTPSGLELAAFAYAFAIAVIALFRIEPENAYYNGLFSIFFPSAQDGFPTPSEVGVAAMVAGAAVAIATGLVIVEHRLLSRNPGLLLRLQQLALPVTAVVAVLFYFDYGLRADALNYMTDIGPALQMLHGGTLMVDSFSQYGPGPVLLLYLAFHLGPPSIPVADAAIQFCNTLFYILFFITLWKLTRYRLAAMWLGFIILPYWLAGWANGTANANAGPSILGGRYLPLMLMVVAFVTERHGRRHSIWTFCSSFLASIWAADAIVGVLALHGGVLAFLNLRDRTLRRFLIDCGWATAPVIAGLLALSIGTLLASGRFPAFNIYLGYFASYNPIAAFWGYPFSGLFWGWIPILLAIVVVLGVCGFVAITGQKSAGAEMWLRNFLPVALLTTFMSAYFVGRAVDFVIIVALLAFSLLAIPTVLWFANLAMNRDRAAMAVSVIPLVAFFWTTAFAVLYLYGPSSQYSLYVQECRDFGRCTPAAIINYLSKNIHGQATLDPGTDIMMRRGDRNLLTDAKRLIERFAKNDARVTVLLGEAENGYAILSDLALMYTGKWHTWPRSLTFSDDLVPALTARILATPVVLSTGNVVLLRRDEAKLGPLETGILGRIKSTGTLCALTENTPEIAVYHFWKDGDPEPADGCIKQPNTNASDVEKNFLQGLLDFIRNIQTPGDMLPDGPIAFELLRKSGVDVPSILLTDGRRASLTKSKKILTLDLFGVSRSLCRALLFEVNRIPGITRVATTGALADERPLPLAGGEAAQKCLLPPAIVRLILDRRP
jgi:hypothetical protein